MSDLDPRKADPAAGHLTHLDAQGHARMVEVGAKPETLREATAEGLVRMSPATAVLIDKGGHAKGDVLAVARVAGIQAAKRTCELIPLCHPIALTGMELHFELQAEQGILRIEAIARTFGRTGVEMEALTAVSVAALTVYDMCKAVDRGIVLSQIQLVQKVGGKSGRWKRDP